METLPLELREEICSYLLHHIDRTAIVAVPASSKAERDDIYSLRLTSKRINTGASQAFVQIVGDIPTECTEESLNSLLRLVELTVVGKTVTCLTFHACKLHITEKKTLKELNVHCYQREKWVRFNLCSKLSAILRSTPRLRHLTCILEAMRGSGILQFGGGQMFALERNVQDMFDPMQVSGLDHKLWLRSDISRSTFSPHLKWRISKRLLRQ